MPSFPNYRLGALAGSGCDSLTATPKFPEGDLNSRIRVWPNPATDMVTVDYGFTDWSKQGEVSMEIVNELGQVVYEQKLPRYSGFQRLNVSGFASGVYQVFVKRDAAVVGVSKLNVIAH